MTHPVDMLMERERKPILELMLCIAIKDLSQGLELSIHEVWSVLLFKALEEEKKEGQKLSVPLDQAVVGLETGNSAKATETSS